MKLPNHDRLRLRETVEDLCVQMNYQPIKCTEKKGRDRGRPAAPHRCQGLQSCHRPHRPHRPRSCIRAMVIAEIKRKLTDSQDS